MPDTEKKSPSIKAFVDKGFPKGKTFLTQFLYSSEFTQLDLKSFVNTGKSKNKYELASQIAEQFEQGNISWKDILLKYVQKPRKWLALKVGSCSKVGVSEHPETLLTEFGNEGWYGPIQDDENQSKWYIHVHKAFYQDSSYQASDSSDNQRDVVSKAMYPVRWTMLAQVCNDYVAISWNGFQYNKIDDDELKKPERLAQFPYWNFVPKYFRAFEAQCSADWEPIILHDLVLGSLWNKYLEDSGFVWKHLRIRADNQGVALNAQSTGALDKDILQMQGLKALSRHLAESALGSLEMDLISKNIDVVERALLRTLIQEWGTKSYEFSLDQPSSDKESGIFRAHCYFANGASSSPIDSFQPG